MITILDPRTIPASDGPLFVSKGGGTDLASRLIRWRTGSWCEHSMLFLNQGKFVWESASSWYGEGPMEDYMVPNVCLKFYKLINQTPATVAALQAYVQARIDAPWIDKVYDWAGILGEAIGFPKFHTPGLEYCSVDDIHALKTISYTLPAADQAVIDDIPNEENPGFLDNVMANTKPPFELYGIYNYKKP